MFSIEDRNAMSLMQKASIGDALLVIAATPLNLRSEVIAGFRLIVTDVDEFRRQNPEYKNAPGASKAEAIAMVAVLDLLKE